MLPPLQSTTETTLALDSAFTFGSAGDAMAAFFTPNTSGNITEIWVLATAFNGTWGSTDQAVNWQVRGPGSGSSNYQPSTTLVSSGTISITDTTANKWWGATGLTVALTKGGMYAVCIGDADGGATNYATLMYHIRESSPPVLNLFGSAFTSTGGWSGAGTAATYPLAVVIKYDGYYIGGSVAANTLTSATNNTKPRGLKITMPSDSPQLAVVGFLPVASGWTAEIREGSSATPSTSASVSQVAATWSATQNNTYTSLEPAVLGGYPVLEPGQTYFLTQKPGSNSSAGGYKVVYNTGASSDMQTFLRGLGIYGANCRFVQGAADDLSWVETDFALPYNGNWYAVPVGMPTIAV